MSIKFSKIKPGMILLDIHNYAMGNTTMRRLGCWEVEILSVDAEKGTALVRWNGNHPTTYSRRELERFYTKPTKKYLDQQKRGRW